MRLGFRALGLRVRGSELCFFCLGLRACYLVFSRE